MLSTWCGRCSLAGTPVAKSFRTWMVETSLFQSLGSKGLQFLLMGSSWDWSTSEELP